MVRSFVSLTAEGFRFPVSGDWQWLLYTEFSIILSMLYPCASTCNVPHSPCLPGHSPAPQRLFTSFHIPHSAFHIQPPLSSVFCSLPSVICPLSIVRCQTLDAIFRDQDSLLKLGRKQPVSGDRPPLVVQHS